MQAPNSTKNSVQGKHCTLCYKFISATAPSYLCDCIQVYNPSRILRSSSHTLRLSLRNDSALATSSTSQKASHSGRRGWSQTGDLESMITNCSGSDHDASARVVLVTTPQDLNPAPPVNGRSVGAFSQAEPGEAKDGYQSAPAPAPALSPLTAMSDPSLRGRSSSLGRRSPPRVKLGVPLCRLHRSYKKGTV